MRNKSKYETVRTASVNQLPPRPKYVPGRDTSADGIVGSQDHRQSCLDSATWHRKVIADTERWRENNPGVPLYQGRKSR